MLDDALKSQLATHLGNLRQDVVLIASLDESDTAAKTSALLEEIAGLNDRVVARFDGDAPRRPSFRIVRADDPERFVTFAGLPLGHEFTSLVLGLLWAGGHPPKVDDALLERVRALEGPLEFEMVFSLSCHNCPDVVQALSLMALENPNVTATLIEGGAFQDEIEERGVMAVPATFLNGEKFYHGKMDLAEILSRLDDGEADRAAAAEAAEEPFETLVIGGGPAGVAAAVYAARKGFRTGIAAERFGGQLQDTLGIENLPGTLYTEGPKLVGELDKQIAENRIVKLDRSAAASLDAAIEAGGMHAVALTNGARLHARSLILAPGARWRSLGIPGEDEYRNRGVAYCPHCDGPLYKGKRIAVVGGGNSGVEAAIDLANIVEHVTLIEYETSLRADEVLQRRLRSLGNVEVLTSARTTRIEGNGEKVVGMAYEDRESGEERTLELAGVFVQIGLVPNTEWLRDSGLELSKHGEIAIDGEGRTNLPGVFAAGDATTVPHKQIVVAMGAGSKAALAAFDYAIRTEPPGEVARAA